MKDQRSNSTALKGLGQLKLIPPGNPPPPRIARFPKTENNHFQDPKAQTKDRLPRINEPRVTRLAQRFMPRSPSIAASSNQQRRGQWPTTPSLNALPLWTRTLVAVLVLAVLLPNLILGSVVWLGMINMPWPRFAALSSHESPIIPPPVLTAPARVEATAGEDVIFPIALDGTDGVPARSVIAISGLPQDSMLSNGRPYGETEWNLKSDEIGDLHLVLPNTASGQSKLTIKLIAPDDAVIANTETILQVASEGSLQRAAEAGSDDAAVGLDSPEPKLIGTGVLGVNPHLTEAQFRYERAQALAATGPQEGIPNLKVAKGTQENFAHSPPDNPTQTTNGDLHTNWIEPSVFVNLRKGPSPSASVISVVTKGAKLRVLGRKRRWVQVTNPATSEKGWIYAGNLAAPKARRGTKRSVPSESSQESQPKSDSLSPSLGGWLASQ